MSSLANGLVRELTVTEDASEGIQDSIGCRSPGLMVHTPHQQRIGTGWPSRLVAGVLGGVPTLAHQGFCTVRGSEPSTAASWVITSTSTRHTAHAQGVPGNAAPLPPLIQTPAVTRPALRHPSTELLLQADTPLALGWCGSPRALSSARAV
eukprot:CAMPEP_0182866502 /NCGR_PEP_ID=MMETSP0034_2-20130328/8239_1 /TAXON_ID=156128 /ORGANISM="Nephroselmis pyriformis, Strain CCMP717" /LENGTH=150 /DNA_ID=CAMNT_0024998831 /DNA_START=749 /DNA_END=1202 /DNA_ORIENTATION=+